MHKFDYDSFYADKYKNYQLTEGLRLNTTPEQFADYLIHISSLNIDTYIEFNEDVGHAIFTYLYLNKFHPISEYTVVTNAKYELSWLGKNIKHVNDQFIKKEADLCYIDIPHSSSFETIIDYHLSKSKYIVLHDIVDVGCQQVLTKWNKLKLINNFTEFASQYYGVKKFRHGYGIIDTSKPKPSMTDKSASIINDAFKNKASSNSIKIKDNKPAAIAAVKEKPSNPAVENKNLQPEKPIYSYDVFDTLIGRKCGDYKRMFDIVAIKTGISKFKENRIKAESACSGNYNYDDIYASYKKQFRESDAQIEDLKKIEFETEMEQAYPIKQNVDRFVNGKDIVISDMYLHKDQINQMLAKGGVYPAETYVSSGGKGHGWIWPKIKEKIIEHYGDNVHSDFKMPMQHKIPARHFLNVNTWQEDTVAKVNIDMANYMRYLRLSTNYKNQHMEQFKNDWVEIYYPILLSMICIVKELTAKGPVHLMYRDCAAIYELMKNDFDVHPLKASRKCFIDKPVGFISYISNIKKGTIFDYFGSGNSYYDFATSNHINLKCDYRLFCRNHYTKDKYLDDVVTDIHIRNQEIFNRTYILENFGNPGEDKTVSYNDKTQPITSPYEFSSNVKTVIVDLLNKIKEDKATFPVKMSNIFHVDNIAKLNPEFYKIFFEAHKTGYNV